MVHQDSKFPCDRHDSLLLAPGRAAMGKALPEAPQIAVLTERPEYVLGAADEESTHVTITGFGDAELR